MHDHDRPAANIKHMPRRTAWYLDQVVQAHRWLAPLDQAMMLIFESKGLCTNL
jgi:hypothetical protein